MPRSSTAHPLSPAELSPSVLAFADVLLRGDEHFPAASTVGTHGVLASRLREVARAEAPASLARAFLQREGYDAPIRAVERLQREEPALLDLALVASYYA
jgi:hypothetical protein